MADEKTTKVKTVTVEALEWHTYNGQAYDVGDTYEIDEQYVDSIETQGKAIRVDRAEAAAKTGAAKPAKGKRRSTAVKPMGTKTAKPLASRARTAKAAKGTRRNR